LYKYLAKAWKGMLKGEGRSLMLQRLFKWRRQPTVVRVEKPTRIDRARALGYKAKVGVIVVRVRRRKGGLSKPRPSSGRRPKRMGVYGYSPAKGIKQIVEEKAARKYPNMKVLGSYYVGEDGRYKWFEVVLVDPSHPAILNDRDMRRRLGLDAR